MGMEGGRSALPTVPHRSGDKATWNFFTSQTLVGKSPAQQLCRYNAWSRREWLLEIKELLYYCFSSTEALRDMGLDWNDTTRHVQEHQLICKDLFSFAMHQAGNRGWSMSAYEFPPFCYSGILVAGAAEKNRAVECMKFDADCLFRLERVAALVPHAQELLRDCLDLWPVAVRIVIECFARERFNPACKAGRRCLATMLLALSDNKCVEDLHRHMRLIERAAGRKSITNISRARACYDSGVIEGRGMRHIKVTRDRFVAAWSRRRSLTTNWRFKSSRHKLNPRWTKIMHKRTWVSTTPESFRACLAAWSWARTYYRLAEGVRPPFGRARLSILLVHGTFLIGPGGKCGVCVGISKWGGLLLPATLQFGRMYSLAHEIEFVHIVYPLQWTAYSITPASPLYLQSLSPGACRNTMLCERSEQPLNLLKMKLNSATSIKSLNFETLTMVSAYFGGADDRYRSRKQCFEHLARKACEGEPENDILAFIARVLMLDATPVRTPKTDAMTEQFFGELDADEQKEHKHFGVPSMPRTGSGSFPSGVGINLPRSRNCGGAGKARPRVKAAARARARARAMLAMRAVKERAKVRCLDPHLPLDTQARKLHPPGPPSREIQTRLRGGLPHCHCFTSLNFRGLATAQWGSKSSAATIAQKCRFVAGANTKLLVVGNNERTMTRKSR